MVDNLDAKMGMVQRVLRNAPAGEEFSEYLAGLQTRVLLTPPDKS
jgi:3'-5' exoribonuclease